MPVKQPSKPSSPIAKPHASLTEHRRPKHAPRAGPTPRLSRPHKSRQPKKKASGWGAATKQKERKKG